MNLTKWKSIYTKKLEEKFKFNSEKYTISSFTKLIYKLAKKFENKYYILAIRFENKKRRVGEILSPSKSNIDREDLREFPDFDSPEYKKLSSLSGTSAWLVSVNGRIEKKFINSYRNSISKDEDKLIIFDDHCYFLGAEKDYSEEAEDPNEVVLEDPEILYILY